MNLSVPANKSEPLTDRQRAALVCLLGDEDAAVHEAVRAKLISSGAEAAESLEPYLLRADPLARRRGREIINHFKRQSADTCFLAFCLKRGEDFDLEEGIFLLVQAEYPDANREAYLALLDSYGEELRERLDRRGTPEQVLGTINEYLFDELGFHGNEDNYYDPRNSYLNCVLDQRTGNPISLCLVYLMIGRRLRLPLAGIGLPGHFICRYQSTRAEFYVDPFNRGRLLSKADCVRYLNYTNHSLDEGHLSPVSSRRILLRICANLHQIYSDRRADEKMARFQRYLIALAK